MGGGAGGWGNCSSAQRGPEGAIRLDLVIEALAALVCLGQCNSGIRVDRWSTAHSQQLNRLALLARLRNNHASEPRLPKGFTRIFENRQGISSSMSKLKTSKKTAHASKKIRRTGTRVRRRPITAPTFIDLFAGCGGLSLGLMNAGWKGLFAIEKSADAFETLSHNLILGNEVNSKAPSFVWPVWLRQKNWDISKFLDSHRKQLRRLRGKVTLVAGGPPCQGFSFAGKRQERDPRNQLFRLHLEIVDILKPDYVLLENVAGISVAFGKSKGSETSRSGLAKRSYAAEIKKMLEEHGYVVQQQIIRACDFGVPQMRPRYFTVAMKKSAYRGGRMPDFFSILGETRSAFLKEKGLPLRHVTAKEALSDLETESCGLRECSDASGRAGYWEPAYDGPETNYQYLMHRGLSGNKMNSLRLPSHRPTTVEKFKRIQKHCPKGKQISPALRASMNIGKNIIVPLAPDRPSHTLTTLPDDFIHYSEPRVHSVREQARLQSFPDWFAFLGKYTTGGQLRRTECPRYTQVGNAVPPLVAEAVGQTLAGLYRKNERRKRRRGRK